MPKTWPKNLEFLARKHQNQTTQLKQIHALLVTTGFLSNTNTFRPPTAVYNVLIKSCLRDPRLAFQLFSTMLTTNTPPSSHTFPSLLKAASSTSSPPLAPSVHTQVLRRGLCGDGFIGTCLLSFYSQLGHLQTARKLFEEMVQPDCTSCNAMLDAFMKNGDVNSAVDLFERMSVRDVVSWTTMINGFVRNGLYEEALWWLWKMMDENYQSVDNGGTKLRRPNEATIVCGLSACANSDGSGVLFRGKEIHAYVVRHEIELTPILGTALIDMYGKCGELKYAGNVFSSVVDKKVCTWNVIISALACNGEEMLALDLFRRMTAERVSPNAITFVAVLTACARAKLLDCGLKWFESMSSDFGIMPTMEHYGCIVHLFGRAGLMDKAVGFIRQMPFEPDASVLGALLGACNVHGDVKLATEVGKKLLALQPLHSGRYMVLANIYAGAGMWDNVSKLKQTMDEKRIQKIAAYSVLDSTDMNVFAAAAGGGSKLDPDSSPMA